MKDLASKENIVAVLDTDRMSLPDDVIFQVPDQIDPDLDSQAGNRTSWNISKYLFFPQTNKIIHLYKF